MGEVHQLLIETVTPLFLGGDDPAQPELRAPSVRGALRYWWRALAAESDIGELRQREGEVFGSVDHRSPVVVRLFAHDALQPISWETLAPRSSRPVRDGPLDPRAGLGYLGFSLVGRGTSPTKHGYGAGQRFRLALGGGGDAPHKQLRQAAAGLWLLLFLGGLGARVRRGFGSLHAVEAPQIAGLPPYAFRGTPRDLAAFLRDGLRVLRQVVPVGHAEDDHPPYSMLRAGAARVVVLDCTWRSWQEALGTVGAALQRARVDLAPTMAEVVRPVAERPAAFPRAGFGLPIGYYDPRTRESGHLELRGPDDLDRRASPLVVRVVHLDRNRYGVLLALFRAEFLPPRTRIVTSRSQLAAPATLAAVETFVASAGGILDEKGRAIEVLEVAVP